jgi:phage shock protein C
MSSPRSAGTIDAMTTNQASNHLQGKLLRRSTDDKWIGGVCSGIARYAGVDVVLVRLLFLVLTVFSFGAGVLAYLVAWVVMPPEARQPNSTPWASGSSVE